MLVLAIDTTTRAGSLALARDGDLLDCWSGEPSLTHARRLPGDILEGLARQGCTLRDVDVFAVAAGPGSFTGLRIGIATIQGLAFALGRPVVGISVLDALACAVADTGGTVPVAAWMDAQRHEVFACLYEPSDEAEGSPPELDHLRVVAGPQVGLPANILADPAWSLATTESRAGGGPETTVTWVGDGALAYRDVIEGHLGRRPMRVLDPVPPLAPAISVMATRRARLGLATAPHAVRPVYIRRPDVELARERRRQGPDGRQGAGA